MHLMTAPTCRFCGSTLRHTFCDLGLSPISNAFVEEKDLQTSEPFFPLHAYVCASCFLVQLAGANGQDRKHHFHEDYAYFSSYSESWLRHARDYVEAMWLMLQQEIPDDYVIATGETHSVRDLLDLAFGRLDLDWQQYVKIDPRYYRPTEVDLLIGDAGKARKKLGWEPKVSFKELVTIMADADLEAERLKLDGIRAQR